MKKLLTLALFAFIVMQGCTDDDLPQPEQRKHRKVYDRVEMEKVRWVG